MGKILPFIEINISRLDPADYLLLAVIALSLVAGIFTILRGLYRRVFKKSGFSPVSVQGDTSGYRNLLGLAQAEKHTLDQQISSFHDTFKGFLEVYQQTMTSGTGAEEVRTRLYSYTIAIRNAYMQLTAMLSTFLTYEQVKSLLVLYKNLDIDGRYSDAPGAKEIEGKLNAIAGRIIAPLVSYRQTMAPDPHKFFSELTIPESPIILASDVVDKELLVLFEVMASYLDKFYREA